MTRLKILFLIFLSINLYANDKHIKLLEPFLDIPYRANGTTNSDERYVVFSNPKDTYKRAGLSGSGFVHAAAKQLLGQDFTPEEIKYDLNQNSGKNSPLGYNWDFAKDVILNIAKHFKYHFINEENIDLNSTSSQGFKLNDIKMWKEVFKKIKKQNIYLVAFSKPSQKKGYKYVYYHPAIIVKDNNNNIFLYHSTPKQGVHRVWLNYDNMLTPLVKEFSSKNDKKVIILELELS